MLKLVILAIAFVVCVAVPAKNKLAPTPPPQGGFIPQATPLLNPPIQTPNSPINCGETPNNALACLGNLEVVNKSIAAKCKQKLSECDKIKCIFRQSGWSIALFTNVDDTVNKEKVAKYFTQYAVDNPQWTPAVQHLKVACLDKDLPAQGITHNCAAYDILHCITTSFLKNAAPSQWSDATKCAYTRLYASSCPICPTACFAAQIPYGSCNACLSLPRVL